MSIVKLKINGCNVQADSSKTILQVVRENNLDDIPSLCYSEELEPYGSCFICVVEVKGRRNLAPSCATKVTEGMEVETRSPRVLAARKTGLELLISNHYADCVSPCLEGCPAHVDAQGYIALCAMGEYIKAVDLIRQTNPFPAICGRVCVRKCEMECRRQDIDSSVAINNIKRFVTDYQGVYDKDPEREESKGKSIGIIGGGPSGLTAAWFLGKKGYEPVVYEMMDKPGGMLRYGIPEYRLPKEVLDKEIDYIKRAGAVINTGVKVGKDISLDDIKKKHDALYISVGAWTSKSMRVEGEHDTEGIRGGINFLIEKADNPELLKGTVVVVGGGNTAMDCARTSWRLNADKVIILYRRTKAEMPADKLEIEDAIKEGIEIMELAAPVGIIRDENKKLKALKCIRMKLGEPDDSGRRRPVPQEGSEFELPCDLVLSSIGQGPVLDGIADAGTYSPNITRWDTIVVDTKTMETGIEGVFAGGDAADDGPTVVIDAIRDGQIAARSIDAYLSEKKISPEPFVVRKEFWAKPGKAELGDIKESPRHELHEIEVEERINSFAEVATGYEYEDAVHECDRCLSCGCLRFNDCDLRKRGEEYGVDMNRYAGYVRKHRIDDRHPNIIYDPNKCILCAKCVRTCDRVLPISALGLVGRGFRTEMRPAMNDPLIETNCIACGNCVDTCPTAALMIKYPFPGRADLPHDKSQSHCGVCSIGCPIEVRKVSDDRYHICSIGEPGKYLCHYGRFINELLIVQSRLNHPIQRIGAKHEEISWDMAYSQAVTGLKEIAEKHGHESVAVFVSPELSNEEMYLASKIARDCIGTNNIGSLKILETGVESGNLDESFGYTASTSDRTTLKDADLIFCNNIGSENDQLILTIEIIDAVKKGAKLINSSSAGDTLSPLSSLALDPMRGRASLMINGIIQVLLDREFFNRDEIKSIPGGENFLSDSFDFSPESISDRTGVDTGRITSAADMIESANKVVFVHSPDIALDASPDDTKVLANFVLLLRAKGIRSDLLLPRTSSNCAGIELTGADPAFTTGRIAPENLPGAKTRDELRALLESGKLKGAIIIGEDPMRDDRTGSYFANIEFLVAMDWSVTETTMFANISIPMTSFLESGGTRCNFEGNLIEYKAVIKPKSGISGWQVLNNLAKEFGIETGVDSIDAIRGAIEKSLDENLKELKPFYWNTGEVRDVDIKGKLVVADTTTKARLIQAPMTEFEYFKRGIRDVGIAYFKVHKHAMI